MSPLATCLLLLFVTLLQAQDFFSYDDHYYHTVEVTDIPDSYYNDDQYDTLEVTDKPGCFCGETNRKKNNKNRIATGNETEVNEYPWMVYVGIQRRNYFGLTTNRPCGGSLISDGWIITAAHCFEDNEADGNVISVTVELGHDLFTPARKEPIHFSQVFMHPDYHNPVRFSNDLALIKLRNPVDFNKFPYLRPICLPSNRDETFTGLTATVAGWGSTLVSVYSTVLLDTNVNVISQFECRKVYGWRKISDDMLCCLSPRDGSVIQGSCGGDSGGPLMVEDESKSFYSLIGVVSWGVTDCTTQSLPGMHSRITSNMNWITETIAGSNTCRQRTD